MALKSSVIFMGNDQTNNLKTLPTTPRHSFLTSLKLYFSVSAREIPRRIINSLVPPIVGERFQYVYVDLVGPTLALVILAGLLHYGHANKLPSSVAAISPTEALLLYTTLFPIFAYVLARLGRANIAFWEITSLLGYGLWGDVLTLITSLLIYQEKSNAFFFCCLILFGGLSALRIALVLLASITVPAARLLVGSLIATIQLLFLVFLHFAFMHRTFTYGKTKEKQ